MEKFSNTRYERLQSDDEENVDEDLPPQVHITAPTGEGTGRNGIIIYIKDLLTQFKVVWKGLPEVFCTD